MEGFGVGVVVRPGRRQEVHVVEQHGAASFRLRDVAEVTADERLDRSQRTQHVQGVVARLET